MTVFVSMIVTVSMMIILRQMTCTSATLNTRMDGSTQGSMVLLTRLNRLVYQHATEVALGMRLKQFAVLSVLREQGAMRPAGARRADARGPEQPRAAAERLRGVGWVERRRDPTDRRRHIVVLTESGEKALDRAERAIEEVEGQVLGALDAEERATLRRLLQKAAAADRATAPA